MQCRPPGAQRAGRCRRGIPGGDRWRQGSRLQRPQPAGVDGQLRAGRHSLPCPGHPRGGGQRRPGGHRRRVQARSRCPVQLRARCVLGHRRGRGADPGRQALAGPRRGRRDRPHGGQARRCPLPVRTPRLHGGLRRPGGNGGPRPPRGGKGQEDNSVQADGRAGPHATDQRCLGPCAGAPRLRVAPQIRAR